MSIYDIYPREYQSLYRSKLLSVLLSVLFLFFLVYTVRLYYYNIEDLSEEDFEQRQKNISTMIQMMIGVIILIIGLYFVFTSKPQEVVSKLLRERQERQLLQEARRNIFILDE